jgi:hypothetical protein
MNFVERFNAPKIEDPDSLDTVISLTEGNVNDPLFVSAQIEAALGNIASTGNDSDESKTLITLRNSLAEGSMSPKAVYEKLIQTLTPRNFR